MFVAAFIPEFSCEAIVRLRPSLRHGAVAVVEGTPPLSYVIATNARARAAGVSVGMTKLQAETFLAGRGVVAERDPLAEQSAHAALVDAACAISPRVEETASDTVLLDGAGLERLFGSPAQVARELAHKIGGQGLEANLAVASTADNAEHAARGFMGVTVLDAANESERLGTLPLEVLFAAEAACVERGGGEQAARISQDERRKTLDRLARMQETLDRWGIRNFRTLASLPGPSLSERLGRHGVRLQKLAGGKIRRELRTLDPPWRFEEAMELDSAVENVEPLLFLLGHMLEQLCARLAMRALCTHELRLRMKLERHAPDETALTREQLESMGDGAITERKLTLPVAMNDARLFLKLLHLQLGARPPGAPVTRLWLEAEPARPRAGQAGLFMPLSPEPEKLELTLARIHKLLSAMPGEGNEGLRAGCAELVDSHQPGAFRMKRFEVAEASEVSDAAAGAEESLRATTMTLRRMRPPVRAEVETRAGIPSRIVAEFAGTVQRRRVLWAAGPWRTTGQWWLRGEVTPEIARPMLAQPWARDEWDIALQQPEVGGRKPEEKTSSTSACEFSLCRLVQEIETGAWWIEGSYD